MWKKSDETFIWAALRKNGRGKCCAANAISKQALLSCWIVRAALCVAWLLGAQSAVHAKGSMLDPVSTQVAAGSYHTCALTTAGQVQCWGRNDYGQLGNGSISPRSPSSVPVSGLSNVVAIATGGYHTCALTTLGKVWCWGYNADGELGDGTTSSRGTPKAVGIDNVVAITAGGHHTCALTTAGAAYCWGLNSFGQLGDGTNADSLTPVAVKSLATGVLAIRAGFAYTCALTATGGVQCWGNNDSGQLGDGTTTSRSVPMAVSDLSSGVVSIAAGGGYTCAIMTSGSVRCWGYNADGQLGDGTKGTDRLTPVDVKNLSNVLSLAAGEDHTCATVKDGSAFCWGNDFYGQLGNGATTGDQLLPVPVNNIGFSFGAVSAGNFHTCALTAGGGVFCWGLNDYGQVGDGTFLNRDAPVGVHGLSSQISALAAGYSHTCALTAGVVYCWGDNSYGQLGDGTNAGHKVPAVVKTLSDVRAIAAGSSHTCALTNAGSVWCWGYNFYGELGDGSTSDRSAPVQVLPSGVAAITAGAHHTCALSTLGAVSCWGFNLDGEVGNGTYSHHESTPTPVSGMASGIRSVVAGGYHTCSLTTIGVMACWGFNSHGQLGDGSTTKSNVPVGVVGLPGLVASVAAGQMHTCVQTTSGVLMCWGANDLGQIGDGTTTDHPKPTCPIEFCYVNAVDGLWSGPMADSTWVGDAIWSWGSNQNGQQGFGDVLAGSTLLQAKHNTAFNGFAPGFTIGAGRFHACVSDDTGLRCMGFDNAGQLGDGATTQRNSPVIILGGQSIVFSTPTSLAVGATLTLTATADSGLPVTFDSWTPSTCTVTGNTLKMIAGSLCGVRASQVGGTLSAGGSAAAAPQQLRLIQALAATTTTLTSSVNPSLPGQSVTFTATITGTAPTGTVTFNDGTTVLCGAVALTGTGNTRTATCTSATLAIGTHPITAVYSGDSANAASTSPVLSQVVQTAGSVGVTLASSLNPSNVGQSVTFTASVTGTAPTGTVAFQDGTAVLCNAVTLTGTGNTRTASCSSTALTVGTHNLTAAYSGDAGNAAATSAVLVQIVQAAGTTPTTTALSLSPDPATVGQSITATVTVRPTSGTGVPSGTVTVSGGTTSCTVTLSAGAGSCTLVFTTAGAKTVTATYGGDGTDAASSAAATVTVTTSTTPGSTVAAPMLDPKSLGLLVLATMLLGAKCAPRLARKSRGVSK